jgi:GTP 3',8-cyclase
LLIDSSGRNLNYLRLSVTDLCNLRCCYCMPESGVEKIEHQEILSYEEMLLIIQAAAAEGMSKIRLTGGEPLIRKDIVNFIGDLKKIKGIDDIRITTNGVLLKEKARELLEVGVRRVNISLDTLDRKKFEQITGRDFLPQVMEGIRGALLHGFEKVKINVVVIAGVNDDEMMDIARLIFDYPLDIRFIEFMPLGRMGFWRPDKFISTREMKSIIKPLGSLVPDAPGLNDGPARVYSIPGAQGRIGFISPLTEHFCASCNRLRLTADGKLRLCLLSELEVDIKKELRSGAGKEEIQRLFQKAAALKPAAHHLAQDIHSANGRTMNRIGG